MAYEQKKERDNRLNMPVDFSLLTLWAPCPTAEGKNSSMSWEMSGPSNDQIQLRVSTNDPVDKEGRDRGQIRAVFPNEVFRIALKFLGEAIRAKGPYKRCIEGLSWFGKDGRLNEPRTDTELFIGKDEDGKMYISLCKYKRPKIVFDFAPSRKNWRFKNERGEFLSDAEESVLYAEGHLKLLEDLQLHNNLGKLVLAKNPDLYKPPYQPKQQSGGQGGGNGNGGGSGYNNSGGGNSGGGQQSRPSASSYSADDDDDIPY